MRLLQFFILFISFSTFGQVVNIETLRKPSDTTKWTGSVSLDVSLTKNVNDLFQITNKAYVQYNDQTNLWLFVNDLNFQKAEGFDLINRGTQHLRYNRKLNETITWEVFGQAQYDAVSEISFRGLVGTGPRFKLNPSEKYRFYIGTLVMYEYEKATNVVADRVQEDIRGSAYVSFSLYPTEKLSIISTSYYQPKFEAFKDYRISSNTSLLFEIYEDLAFKTTFNYFFDAFPVSASIPKTQYELTNGLLYTF